MIAPLRWVAGTRVRLLIAINVAAVLMLALAPLLSSYIRNDSTSPSLDMLLITAWMLVLLIVSVLEAVLAGDLLFRHQWRERVVLGQSDLPVDDDDPEVVHRAHRTRMLGFAILVAAFALVNGALVNMASGRFLDYYGELGWYRTVMRGDDASLKSRAIRDATQTQTATLDTLVDEVLVPALGDDDPAVRQEALWGLVEVSRRMSRSVDILNADNAPADRWEYAVANKLRREVAPLGRSLFQTGEGEARVAAARLLGSLRDHAAIPLLGLAVQEEGADPEVRAQALVALGEMASLEALEPLLWAVERLEADQRAVTMALWGVGEIFRTWAPDDRDALLPPVVDRASEVLARSLRSASRVNQCVAAESLIRMADARTADAVMAAFEAPESSFDCPTEELREHDGRVRTLAGSEPYRLKLLRVIARVVVDNEAVVAWLDRTAERGGWGETIQRELDNVVKLANR